MRGDESANGIGLGMGIPQMGMMAGHSDEFPRQVGNHRLCFFRGVLLSPDMEGF
jgi:hypothetical protein